MVTPPWEQPGRGLFSISVAAELTGLHPQTLRIYEQEGLLRPARSSGGTRRYSTDDIDRLHHIMALTSDGLNLAGVRRVLELQEQTRRLQAEIEQLRALTGPREDPAPNRLMPPGKQQQDPAAAPQRYKKGERTAAGGGAGAMSGRPNQR